MRARIAIVLGVASAMGACSSDPVGVTRVVNAAEFREMGSVAVGSEVGGVEAGEGERVSLGTEPETVADVVVISPEQARGRAGGPGPQMGSPQGSIVGSASGGAGPAVLIDAKVGDINGRAIYADEFLSDLEARFTQEASRMPVGAWLAEVDNVIDIKIRALLRQELLLGEALATMPEQQRTVGLSAALKRMQGRLNSRNRGSAARAEQRIREELGMSVDEFLTRVQNDQLTTMILEMRVEDRVNISWREIVQEYNRSIDVFNPEPQAFFRMIRVSADDAAGVGEIARQLDSGVAFAEVASLDINRFEASEGGLMTPETIETTIDALRVFKDERLNEAAISLQPGEFAGPIQTETSVGQLANWVYLDRIREIKVPLYDAQLAIAENRETEQTDIELDRYYQRLLRGASLTDLDQMRSRLMRIAVERFNPKALAAYLGTGRRQ